MRNQVAILIVIGFAMPCGIAQAQILPLTGLSAPVVEQREASYRAVSGSYADTVAHLIELAKQRKTRYNVSDSRAFAVRLLGEMGAREAIPVLIEEIEYFQPCIRTEDSPLVGYPCAEALHRIGMTAVGPILTHLQVVSPKHISDPALNLYASVLLSIGIDDGGHREVVERVRRAHERAKVKNGLEPLLRELENRTRNWP